MASKNPKVSPKQKEELDLKEDIAEETEPIESKVLSKEEVSKKKSIKSPRSASISGSPKSKKVDSDSDPEKSKSKSKKKKSLQGRKSLRKYLKNRIRKYN